MNKTTCLHLAALCAVLFTLTSAHLARAAANGSPPTQLTYQGFLTDANGVPLGNTAPTNKEIIFRIYGAATGGAPLWTSSQYVTLDKGHFSVLLGEGSQKGSEPFAADLTGIFTGSSASDRYLELTVDSVPILPRLRFLPAPYAILAKGATQLVDPGTGNPSLTSSGGNLSFTGTVTGNGSGLTALNPANLAAGTIGSALTLNNSANSFTGSGANLTALNANQLTAGTVPDARLSGTYTSALTLNNSGNSLRGNFTGNVGIGTTSPSAPLQINAGATAQPDGNGLYVYNPANAGGKHAIVGVRVSGTSAGNPFFSMDAENIGGWCMGLDNSDSQKFKIASAWDNLANATRLTINRDNGYVGIGTTTPSAALDVNGRVRAGDVYATSTWHLYDDGTGKLIMQKDGHSGFFYLSFEGVYNTGSDRRLKKDIAALESGSLKKVLQLQPVRYRFRTEKESDPMSIGFIAQEVQEVFPELVTSLADGKLGLSYSSFGVLSIAAIQELAKQVEALRKSEARVAQLEQKVSRLAELEQKVSRMDALERKLADLEKLVARIPEPRQEVRPAAAVPASEVGK